MDRDKGKIHGRCLDGPAGLVSLGEAPWQVAAQLPAFPAVSAQHKLKSCSLSVSLSVVDFTIVNTDWMNDNERESSENLEVW